MPIFRKGNMFKHMDECRAWFVTTNSFIKSNGALVMGKGAAKQARDTYYGIDRAFGTMIMNECGHLGRYGVVTCQLKTGQIAGAFQVKTDYKRQAILDLIEYSANKLLWWARGFEYKVHMNFPGIGNGGLARTTVMPLLRPLPNNIVIWEL